MEFLQNLVINLKATGPAAVVCVWFVCMTALGLSSNPMAFMALGPLVVFGMVAILAMLSWSQKK